ncbi:Hypothetical predicted protein [Prunus dulcis]|uniref:Uncharacterized protein n=1 Tax=Prunus dulcis TaxID=3755 RepID=A0A5E4FGK9_PRUDU|nr:Hypothetical predicted protein [Prunus dulcis]
MISAKLLQKRGKTASTTQSATGPSYPSNGPTADAATLPPDTLPESTAPIAPPPGLVAMNTIAACVAAVTIGLTSPKGSVAKIAAQAQGPKVVVTSQPQGRL